MRKQGGGDMAADLSRFLKAQEQDYEQALREIRSGRKRSHWMWYIFPQIQGLGFSPTAQYYEFGISTEQNGHVLNEGLIFQKEGFGARGVCYDAWELALH